MHWVALYQFRRTKNWFNTQFVTPSTLHLLSWLQRCATSSWWSSSASLSNTSSWIVTLKFDLHLLTKDNVSLTRWRCTVESEFSSNIICHRKVIVARVYSEYVVCCFYRAPTIKCNSVADSPSNFDGLGDATISLGIRMLCFKHFFVWVIYSFNLSIIKPQRFGGQSRNEIEKFRQTSLGDLRTRYSIEASI